MVYGDDMKYKYIVTIVLILLLTGTASAWIADYDHRMQIGINNTGDNLTYYQYNFTVDTATLVAAGKMNANGSDCRITNVMDVMQEFWNETAFNSSSTKIWVNATTLGNVSNTTHYFYYGNSAASDIGDISTAFMFGDSFSTETPIKVDEPTNPTRSADDPWEGAEVNEFSNFHYGGEYISWYRGNHGGTYETGFENSTDGITWTGYSGNPILTTPQVYSYVVNDSGRFYLFNNHDPTANGNGDMYMYNVTDYTNPVIMNGGNPVYTRSSTSSDWDYKIFNPGITIDGNGTWHMLLEGQSSTSGFRIGYAYSNLSEMNWSKHRSSSYVIDTSGNPDLEYVPDRNALMSVHGDISGSRWTIVASYANLSDDLTSSANWHASQNFLISASGIHLADPSLMYNFNATHPTMLSYNYNQASIYQCYYTSTLNEFYDGICALDGWQTTNKGIYSIISGNLVMGIASPTTQCLNSNISLNNYIVESRLKTSAGEIHVEMSNAIATIPVQERAAIRTGDTFVGYIGGAYTTGGTGVIDTWYRSVLSVPSSGTAGAYVYSDDKTTLHVSKTGTPTYTTSYIALLHVTSGIGHVDWIFARQYAATEPTASLGAEENAPADIIIGANQHGMLRKNVAAAETFSIIAAGIDHDRCYTWWDSSNDRWESYRVGYSYNAAKSVPEYDSYFVLMDSTGATISRNTAWAETIAIPAGYYATYLRESTNKTLSAIKTDMGGNVNDLWAFNSSAGAWIDTGTYSVQPNQGLMVNSSTGFNWDGSVP